MAMLASSPPTASILAPIIGGVAAALVLVLICLLAYCFVWRRRQTTSNKLESTGSLRFSLPVIDDERREVIYTTVSGNSNYGVVSFACSEHDSGDLVPSAQPVAYGTLAPTTLPSRIKCCEANGESFEVGFQVN
jgi:hypothetical protein